MPGPARSGRPTPARSSVMTSGVSDSDTRVATRSPTARPRGDSGPTSSTVPMSMPPDPVTGFCILPRVATMSSTSARTASPSPACFSDSWRKDAASRLSVSMLMRTSSGHSSGEASSRWAACGSDAPAGSRTRCRAHRRGGGARHRISHHLRHAAEILRSERPYHWSLSRILPRMSTAIEQPYVYRHRELVEPDWTRFAGLARRHRRGLGQRPVAAGPLRQEHQAAARADG